MSEDDVIYYQRRAQEERAAAQHAPDITIARIHWQLALNYIQLLDRAPEASAQTPPPDLTIVNPSAEALP
jgi:hypothetical protein